MNREMIERWNSRVGENDICYHLGDVSFGSNKDTLEIIKQLKGRKILVRGNHDASKPAFYRDCGFEMHDKWMLGDVLLVHNPWQEKRGPNFLDRHPKTVTLHGHVHEKWAERLAPNGARFINVGVDVRDFYPKTMEELLAGAPDAADDAVAAPVPV